MIDLLFVALFQAAAGEPQAEPAPAPAPQAVQPPQAQPAQQASDALRRRRERERITCRDQAVLGSRMSNRVCMSEIDREAIQQETQRIAEEMHHSGAVDGN